MQEKGIPFGYLSQKREMTGEASTSSWNRESCTETFETLTLWEAKHTKHIFIIVVGCSIIVIYKVHVSKDFPGIFVIKSESQVWPICACKK